MKREQEGQILVLFALLVVVLLGFAALAIDVSSAYSAQRAYRTYADAAALAGGQQIQVGTTRTPDYNAARTWAETSLSKSLGATASCSASVGRSQTCTFPGTPYVATVSSPAGGCSSYCDPNLAVAVSLSNPEFAVSFARLFGVDHWNVGTTSIAGMAFGTKYALVTLRPPNVLPNGLDQNRQDINLGGTSTRVNILSGDVGTNTSAYTNSSNYITLATGYYLYHKDDITPDPWNKDLSGNPRGRLMTDFVSDPNYLDSSTPPTLPSSTGTSFNYDKTAATGPWFDTGCAAISAALLSTLPAGTVCYRPGVYLQDPFTVSGSQSAYLEPGMYFLYNGASVSGRLYGGLASGTGVSIWLPNAPRVGGGPAPAFTANNVADFQLNTASGVTAPVDGANVAQVTPDGLILTMQVQRVEDCFSGVVPLESFRGPCTDPTSVINIAGGTGAGLYIGGVLYGPSDEMQINANNTSQHGTVGQIISWRVTYNGGATLDQTYPSALGTGMLRLDSACTVPSTPCNP